jgi:hypothetical protein
MSFPFADETAGPETRITFHAGPTAAIDAIE